MLPAPPGGPVPACRFPSFCHRLDRSARLSDAERLYFVSQAIEASVDAIAFTDGDGRIAFVNRAFVRLWGYQRAADVGGRPLSSFVQPANPHAPMNVCTNWTGDALGVASSGVRFPIAGSNHADPTIRPARWRGLPRRSGT